MSSEIEKREKQEVVSTTAEQLQHSGNAFSPDLDIYISNSKVVFIAELPGVAKGDVSITVDETNSLIIRGKNSCKEPEDSVFRQFAIGDYYRAFQLSDDYDKDNISAKFDNGLLEVTIMKKEQAKPRRIEIKA